MKLVMNGVERCRGFFQLSSEEKGKGICCEKYLAMRKGEILLKELSRLSYYVDVKKGRG